MAVITDVGNLRDIHPSDKETVGRRLALLALNRDYGFKAVKADSPTLKESKVENGKFVLTFNHAESWRATSTTRAACCPAPSASPPRRDARGAGRPE